MNHCILEVKVKKAPSIRYTQDNQTPIAEMEVLFPSLKTDDAPGVLKVVGWGNMAQDLQDRIQEGEKLVLEGRLRMNTITRQDGIKEKQAELTLSKFHKISGGSPSNVPGEINPGSNTANQKDPLSSNQRISNSPSKNEDDANSWNSSPLIPDTDDIPF